MDAFAFAVLFFSVKNEVMTGKIAKNCIKIDPGLNWNHDGWCSFSLLIFGHLCAIKVPHGIKTPSLGGVGCVEISMFSSLKFLKILWKFCLDHNFSRSARIEPSFCIVAKLEELKNFYLDCFESYRTKNASFDEIPGYLARARARARARPSTGGGLRPVS